jgi:hypothetical protein
LFSLRKCTSLLFINVNIEDFPKVLHGSNWGDQSLVPNIGEEARAEDDVKEFKFSQLEFVVCIIYNFI